MNSTIDKPVAIKSIKPFDFQKKAIDEIVAYSGKSVMYKAAPAAGKTIVAAGVAFDLVARGHRVLIVTHRKEIKEQTESMMSALGFSKVNVVFITIQKLRTPKGLNAAAKFRPSAIIFDECHHWVADEWRKPIEELTPAIFIGLTATDYRVDDKPLEFEYTIQGPDVETLQELGLVVDIRTFAPPGCCLDRKELEAAVVRVSGGDFDAETLYEQVHKKLKYIAGDSVKHLKNHFGARKTIIFCISRGHADDMKDVLEKEGIESCIFHGELGKSDREEMLAQYASGMVNVMLSVDLAVEGLNIPDIAVVMCLRPTMSRAFWVQMNGRGARATEGKTECIVLDLVGNWQRFGVMTEAYKGVNGPKLIDEETGEISLLTDENQPNGKRRIAEVLNDIEEVKKRKIVTVEMLEELLRVKGAMNVADISKEYNLSRRAIGLLKKKSDKITEPSANCYRLGVSLKTTVLDIIAQNGPISRQGIANRANISRTIAYNICKKLVEAGKIDRVSRGCVLGSGIVYVRTCVSDDDFIKRMGPNEVTLADVSLLMGLKKDTVTRRVGKLMAKGLVQRMGRGRFVSTIGKQVDPDTTSANKIMRELNDKELKLKNLAKAVVLAESTVRFHLAKLIEMGLVRLGNDMKYRKI